MAITNAAARLSQFRLFEGLSLDELTKAGAQFDERSASAGDVLHKQGDWPAFLYLVEFGEVLVEGRDPSGRPIVRRVAQAGDMVGRRAASDNVRHMATATVTHDARLLAISLGNLRILLNLFPLLRERLALSQVINRLLAIPLFSVFSQQEVIVLADLVRMESYVPGQTIFRQNDLADAMYVIDTGQVVETQLAGPAPDGSWPKYLAAGNFFGRAGLEQGKARRATAVAETDVRLFRISQQGLAWLLEYKPEFERALKRPDMLSYLSATYLFNKLSLPEIRQLAGYTGLAHYRPGSLIIRYGETDQTLYILYRGQALARGYDAEGRARPPEGLIPGAVLGEHSLFLSEPHPVSVEAPVPSDWMYVSRDDLERYLAQRSEVVSRLQLGASVKQRQRLKRYSWMDLDEQILFNRRRHWFVLAERLSVSVLLLLFGLLLMGLPPRGSVPWLDLLGAPLVLGGAAWAVWVLIDWSNDFYVLTTKRVAQIDRVILFRSSREEVPLDKVQNVNLSQIAIGTYLGFGTLIIETAASFGGARIRFSYIPDPSDAQRQIMQTMGIVRARGRQEAQRAIRDKLAARLGGGNQPYVPAVATAPYAQAPTPASEAGWWRRLSHFNPFWMEKRTPDELRWRKHWLQLLSRVWLPSLTFILVLLGLIFLARLADGLPPALLVLGGLGLLATGVWWWWGWANWGNDLYIVTSDRIIDIEKTPLGLKTERTETMFDRVQNVSYVVPNPLATLLKYGRVIVHTAGAEGRLTFDHVPRPSMVQEEIFRRLNAYNELRRRRDQEERWSEMPEWFANYAELQRKDQQP